MVNNDITQQSMEHLQPSAIVIVFKLLAAIFMLDLVYAMILIGFFSLNELHDWHNSYLLFLLLVHFIKYALLSAVLVKLFSDWVGRAYYLSGHHLFERLGIVNITETTHELSQIKSVVMKQTWLGKRFNYGTITLSMAGSGEQKEIMLRDITSPHRYKDYFDQHLQVQGWVR